MTVGDIDRYISAWAPKDIAWERDNVGLQVGDPSAGVRGILVCLDCTAQVVAEAKRRRANLIISHHPILFRPPKSITPRDEIGRTIRMLMENRIHLYSAHTNLDFTRGGTSFTLGEALGLRDLDFLHKSYRIEKKIVTFVPESHKEKVRDAMAGAGAGAIGNYDRCAFTVPGTGSFRGGELSKPRVGTKGRIEQVPEVRLEMIAKQWDVPGVLGALKSTHPYEEAAYDVYALENTNNDYGMGIIGNLAKPVDLFPFLRSIKRNLRAKALRYTAGTSRKVRRVAACGGAGGELLDTAIAAGADVFISADIRYHDFHHANGRIVLVDAGHYETEHLVVNAVIRKLKKEIQMTGIPVMAAQTLTNPILYF